MRFSIFLIFILLSLFSCTKFKYEKKDIVGEWEVNKYSVNDADSTEYFEKFKFCVFSLNTDNQIYIACQSDDSSFSSEYGYGNWNLSSKNEIINIDMDFINENQDDWINIPPFYQSAKSAWKIINLTQNSLEIRTEFNGTTYKLNLN